MKLETVIDARLRRWTGARQAHLAGHHLSAVCTTPDACRRYARILEAQVSLWTRAAALPQDQQEALHDAVLHPDGTPLILLIQAAETAVSAGTVR